MGPRGPNEPSNEDGGATSTEAARYLAETIGGLLPIARQHRFRTLSYLLEMAQLEAEQISNAEPK